MKYFTKEWYQIISKSFLISSLKINAEAKEYNEELFKKEYQLKEKDWLDNRQKVIVNYRDDPKYKEFIAHDFPNGFEKDKEIAKFQYIFNEQVKNVNSILPKNISKKVEDLRLLTLGVTTLEIAQEIKKYLQEKVDKPLEAYMEYFKKFVQEHKLRFHFHDAVVKSIELKEKDLIINLDPNKSFNLCSKIIFKNCNNLESINDIIGSTWLYEEIYYDNNQYLVNILLEKEELMEIILKSENIILK